MKVRFFLFLFLFFLLKQIWHCGKWGVSNFTFYWCVSKPPAGLCPSVSLLNTIINWMFIRYSSKKKKERKEIPLIKKIICPIKRTFVFNNWEYVAVALFKETSDRLSFGTTQKRCADSYFLQVLSSLTISICTGLVTSCNHCRHRGVKTFSACFSASAVSDQAVKSLRLCQKCILKRSGKIFLTLDVLIHFSEQSIVWVEHISTLFSIRLENQMGKIPWCTNTFLCLFAVLCFISFGFIWTIYFSISPWSTCNDNHSPLGFNTNELCNITKLQIYFFSS